MKLASDPSPRYHFIPPAREPSPVRRRVFQDGIRELTKEAGESIPQIDLSRPSRRPAGCQSPIESTRPVLFQQPREAVKYDDVEGSHPRSMYPRQSAPRDTMGNVIPNQARLFAEPREVLKYQEIEGSHAIGLDLSKPPRDVMPLCEQRGGRRLFEEPRDWQKLVDDGKTARQPIRRCADDVNPEVKRTLFEQPREVIKYLDVPGSHPSHFAPGRTRRVSPTFASSLFAVDG
jgi:hypothetical protein